MVLQIRIILNVITNKPQILIFCNNFCAVYVTKHSIHLTYQEPSSPSNEDHQPGHRL